MKLPIWFLIIKNWKEKKMGEYGPSLPFLVGSIAYRNGNQTATLEDVYSLLNEFIENHVNGYITIIRWCGDIEEAVISTQPQNFPFYIAIKDSFPRSDGKDISLAFTEDLMSMFNLNCTSAKDCIDKLAFSAKPYVEKGLFSKNINPETMQREFGSFTDKDIDYIDSMITLTEG
jgi:hypothetical protein